MDCSTPGFPVHYQLPEPAQTHIHWLCDATHHLILCHPLLLLPSIFPSIKVFSKETVLCIRWPKYWSFSFSISPSDEYSELISFRTDLFDLLAVQGTLKSFLQHYSSKASILWHSAFLMRTPRTVWKDILVTQEENELMPRRHRDVGMWAYGLVLYKYQHQVWTVSMNDPCALKANWQTNKICKYVRFRVCLLIWGFITESIS